MDSTMDRTKEIASRLTAAASKSTIALFVIAALMLIIIIVVYIVYRLKRRDLQNVVVVKNSMRLYNMKQTYKFDGNLLPATLNGQEYSFSFWLYLLEYTPLDNHALIFSRGGSGTTIDRSNPIVFLNKNTNKLHVGVKTTMIPTEPLKVTDGNAILDGVLKPSSGFMTGSIDYVPLQRWVQVVFVVQDNLLTLYMDGDIYTTNNIFDMPREGDKRPVFKGSTGDLFVGSLPNLTTQLRGFISKLQFYNFAVMHNDVKAMYSEGPSIQGMLSRMGLPEYGLRSPIYKIEG